MAPYLRLSHVAAVLLVLVVTACGRPSVDVGAIIERLKNGDYNERCRAAIQLQLLGASAAPAVPSLIVATNDSDRFVRGEAIEALGRIGESAVAAVPTLIECVRSRRGSDAESAARALGRIGPGAKAAVPTLALALSREDLTVGAVAHALAKMGPSAAAAVPQLIAVVESGDRDPRGFAFEAIAEIGPAAQSAGPALARIVADQAVRPARRSGAAWALGRVGLASPEVIAALETAARDGVESARSALSELKRGEPK